MKKRPLVCLAIIFSSGIIFARFIKTPFLLTYLPAVIFIILAFLIRKRESASDILLVCLVFLLGASLLRVARLLPACHISKYISYYNKASLYTIKGFVASQPLAKADKVVFRFKTEAISFNNLEKNCSGDILVYLRNKKDIHYGEELILSGNLYRPFGLPGGGLGGYRAYLYNQGIYAVMKVKTGGFIVRLKKDKGAQVLRFVFRTKDKMEEIIFRHTSLPGGAILEAMILGERKKIPPLVNDSMVKSGTVHILPRLYTKMPSIAF